MLNQLYPEQRQVSEERVIQDAYDILIDDAILEHQQSGCPCGGRCEDFDPDNVPRPTLQEAIDLHHDRGTRTFSRE